MTWSVTAALILGAMVAATAFVCFSPDVECHRQPALSLAAEYGDLRHVRLWALACSPKSSPG